MKKIIVMAAVLGLVLATSAPSSAHVPSDKNFAAVMVPIGEDGVRDLNIDGDLGEWDNVPSAFWTTHDDMVEMITGTQGDPDAGNLAERIIVGWHPETNYLYFMEEKFDQQFFTVEETNDNITIVIDANHSGGQFYGEAIEEVDYSRSAQHWKTVFNAPDNPIFLWGGTSVWATAEPYTGSSFIVDGENGGPSTLTCESWFTPYDDLPSDSTGPDDDRIIINDLTEGAFVGIGLSVQDDDNGPSGGYDGYWVHTGDVIAYYHADALVDYLLQGFNANYWVAGGNVTAVETDSWARIKAGFSN